MSKKPFISTTLWVLLGRAGGVLVPFLVALFMGAGPETDAFFFAYSIIFALLNIFAQAFEASLVPFIIARKEDRDRSISFTAGTLGFGLPAAMFLSFGLAFLIPLVLKAGNAALIFRLYVELLPGLWLAVLISAYQGYFYARKNFWFPAISPLLRTITMTLFFLLGRETLGIHSLTAGFCAGEILRWMAAHLLLAREGKVRLGSPFGEFKKIMEFFNQTGFQVLALVAVSIIPLTDPYFAAHMGAGSISLYSYADRLVQVPYLLFFYGFTQIYHSFWSESHLSEEISVFFSKVQRDMRVVFAWGLVLVVALWFLSEPLIHILFRTSNLDNVQSMQMADIFRWMAIGFLPGIIRTLYGRVLIIIKKSVFYSFQSWAELGIKIVLNYFFVSRFGLPGLAMATAVTYVLTVIYLYVYLNKYVRTHSGRIGETA